MTWGSFKCSYVNRFDRGATLLGVGTSGGLVSSNGCSVLGNVWPAMDGNGLFLPQTDPVCKGRENALRSRLNLF
ncbi:hypothetical protein [Phormidium sp. CCY1219]|uniref:hypothetical protein n=1 Tax=Phormidium sp. CCY1219 TaxID=2886104 RepID=UPI002D1F633E|nr:hypothetical protein [Phormidium sp. CCY1219]MEB3831283.1 hypothetical protein [Phormidium sp. CCY1219]